jgi:hypothetical protein
VGEWAEPGDAEGIRAGMKRLLEGAMDYEFAEYLADHSWDRNAETVLSVLASED